MQGIGSGREEFQHAPPGLGIAQQTTTGVHARPVDTEVYASAGVQRSDVKALYTYDAFSPLVLFTLERFGFCGTGEAADFVQDGRIAPGGALPVNTNGGGLSYCHPGMYGLLILIEGVRQLRGDCGERQVKKHDTAMVHGNGGVLSAQASVILGTGATL